MDASELIERLELKPLGFEGGYYRETYRSASRGDFGQLYDGLRSGGTAIFYLLTPNNRSLLHRLRTDEVYHFYSGDPVELLNLHPEGTHEQVRLGSDILAGDRVQYVVPAGHWQGSELIAGGRYALMGTTMSPGFELADFELGRRRDILASYPNETLRSVIERLTPNILETSNLELTAATRDLLHAEEQSFEALCAGLGAQSGSTDGAHLAIHRSSPLESLTAAGNQGVWYVVERHHRSFLGWMRYVRSRDNRHQIFLDWRFSSNASAADEALQALLERAFSDDATTSIVLEGQMIEREAVLLTSMGWTETQNSQSPSSRMYSKDQLS